MTAGVTEDDLLAVEDELRAAMLAGDVATLDRLLDDDLMFVSHFGAVVDKATDLEMHRTRRLRIHSMAPSGREIRRWGDTAVVTVQMDIDATVDGVDSRDVFRYTRVWRLTPTGWRIVAGQMGRVAP
jgi:ketosteroid isomerase-like protein